MARSSGALLHAEQARDRVSRRGLHRTLWSRCVCGALPHRGTAQYGFDTFPFNGFLLLQGIETMALRVERHVENARKVAEFLRGHERVAWVNYAGFSDSPLYPMAHRYLGERACSLLTFGVKGGFEPGVKCFDALRLFKRMVNMGDAKSLSCHPRPRRIGN